jgi:hypothetical protein
VLYAFQAKASSNSPVYSGSDQELGELDPKLENLPDSDSDSDEDEEEEEGEGQCNQYRCSGETSHVNILLDGCTYPG